MNTKKMTNRQIQAVETKKKIYDNAYELFQKYGFKEVSVDDIVKKAGVSKGAFYVHFNSKDSLIADVVTDYVKGLDIDYKNYIESFSDNTNISDILFSFAGKISDILSQRIGCDLMRIIYEAQLAKTISPVPIMGYNRDLYKLFANIIHKGIQQGEFKEELTVEAITKYCVMTIRGAAYEWCVLYPDYNLKEGVMESFKILLAGIKKND